MGIISNAILRHRSESLPAPDAAATTSRTTAGTLLCSRGVGMDCADMETISPSSLFMVGRRVAKHCRGTLAFVLALNILIITVVAVLCISGYGVAGGLTIVVLALAPTLMLVNIALFAQTENEQHPTLLRDAISTNRKDLQRGETLGEKKLFDGS